MKEQSPYQPYQPPSTDVSPPAERAEGQFSGLHGWLILVAISIVVSPLRIVFQIFPIYAGIFSNGTWEKLTTPGSVAYHSLWSTVLIGEIAINAALVLWWLWVAYLFFSKKKNLPKHYTAILVFTTLFLLGDAVAVSAVMPGIELFDSETVREISRSLIATLVWIPYMRLSQRVKATFVR